MSFEVRGLRLKRGNFLLNLDFCISSGKLLVLLGPSGCGKTTLLRAIAGLEPLDAGEIVLDGNRIDTLPVEKRRIGFVFQDLALFEQLTVKNNIAYSLVLRHETKNVIDSRIDTLAKRFRIEHLLERYPSALSGGERQRVALARVIASNPALVLLDEPLSALDAPLRKEMRRFLRMQLSEQGITAIHVTHDAEEAADLADELIVMREGLMLQQGTVAELSDSPATGWIARFLNTGLVVEVSSVRISACFAVAETPFGPIWCRTESRDAAQMLNEKLCVHIPYSAMVVTNFSEHLPASDASNHTHLLYARVLHIVCSSSHGTRLMLALMPAERDSSETLPFEMTIPYQSWLFGYSGSNPRFACIHYDAERCSLLPKDR